MAFENEKLDLRKIKDYGVEEVFYKYISGLRDREPGKLRESLEDEWTIDRERDIFLVSLGRTHRQSDLRIWGWLLSIQGNVLRVFLRENEKTNFDKAKDVLTWVWDFKSIDFRDVEGISKQEVLWIIKEAIVARGEGTYSNPDNKSKKVYEFEF